MLYQTDVLFRLNAFCYTLWYECVLNVVSLLCKQEMNLISLPDAITRQSNLIVRLNTIQFWNQINRTENTILWIADFLIRHQSINCIFSFVMMKKMMCDILYRDWLNLWLQTAREIHSKLNKWYVWCSVWKKMETNWIEKCKKHHGRNTKIYHSKVECNHVSNFPFSKKPKRISKSRKWSSKFDKSNVLKFRILNTPVQDSYPCASVA